MELEVLMSCMHQNDAALVSASQLTGNVVMINQCDKEGYGEYPTANGAVRMFSTTERGLTKSRNMAIRNAKADICLICDDDEKFVPEYEQVILNAYQKNPQADIIIFKMENRPPSFPDRLMRLKFPKTMKVSSWQISFRREKLIEANIAFDELMGAGSGNGAEEELKFLWDCQRAGLEIWYVPEVIASVAQECSTWFKGFDETFFENRGATTRYVMGIGLASLYAIYYAVRKRKMYSGTVSVSKALRATFRGIRENRISHQAKQLKEQENIQ